MSISLLTVMCVCNIPVHVLYFQLNITHVSTDILEKTDIHIHFPAGAVGKDGPSAGVTVVTVLTSLFTNRCVRSDTAMTGEITLRGQVLPVSFVAYVFLSTLHGYSVRVDVELRCCLVLLQIGGVKEKVLAAHRAGIRRVILPKRNEKDLNDVATNIKV